MAEVRPETLRSEALSGFGSLINPTRSMTTAKAGDRVCGPQSPNPTQPIKVFVRSGIEA